jgi:signal peptidase II
VIGLIGFSVFILALDLVTKFIVQARFQLGESLPVIGETLKLTYIHNPRGAFGMSIGSNSFHILISIVVIAAVLYALFKEAGRSRVVDFSLAGIVAGAIGNLVDRIRMGEVVDFINVNIPDIDFLGIRMQRWPIFNIADAAVTVGVIVLLVWTFTHRTGRQEEQE